MCGLKTAGDLIWSRKFPTCSRQTAILDCLVLAFNYLHVGVEDAVATCTVI